MHKILYLLFLLNSLSLFAQNQPPVISNVQVAISGGNILNLTYDLEDAESDPVEITFRATEKGGLDFNFNTSNATGDVGTGILPGQGKQLTWDFSAYATAQPEFRLQLVAADFQPLDLPALLAQVDSTRLFGDLAFLEGIRHRTAGPVHLQEVKDFIKFHFEDNGLETELQAFTFGSYQAHNIIGRLIGTENEATVYILGGHFDSVSNSPGADDNASAVAGMLEAMRILSNYGFRKSIRFIGFDLEEVQLNGSMKYVETGIKPGETVAGMIDFEMIGYYTEVPNTQTTPTGFNLLFPDAWAKLTADQFRGNFITNVGGGFSSALATAYENAATQYVPDLKVITLQPSFFVPDLSRSDHASFWLKGIPAIMLTDGAEFRNSNYHTPNDTLGSLNFTFMHNVVQAAIATLADLAEIQHVGTWWADTEFFTPTSEATGCEWLVSPNPSGRFLKISWANCQTDDLAFELMDLTGRLVQQAKIAHTVADNSFTFDLSQMERGIYFLRMNRPDGSFSTQKIVLQ